MRGWEGFNFLVEVLPKNEVGEERGKRGDFLIKGSPKGEVGEGGWKVVH